jgi:hypothetical protein
MVSMRGILDCPDRLIAATMQKAGGMFGSGLYYEWLLLYRYT